MEYNGNIKMSLDEESKAALQRFGDSLQLFTYKLNQLTEALEKMVGSLDVEVQKFNKVVERMESRPWEKRN